MANLRLIRRRIKSAKNISQITYAMQMVAASKMKKAQATALSGRPYASKILEAVSSLSTPSLLTAHPLLTPNSSSKKLIILFSTNKGLCGGLNTQLFRLLDTQHYLDSASFLTLGHKGESFVIKSGLPLIADFSAVAQISALAKLCTTSYTKGEYGHVYLAYNSFVNSLKQEPLVRQLLPLSVKSNSSNDNLLIEPSRQAVLNDLLNAYIESQLKSALAESIASEYSARMITMKSATDNAKDLITSLTISYNKVRQEKITSEISDIVTSRLSV